MPRARRLAAAVALAGFLGAAGGIPAALAAPARGRTPPPAAGDSAVARQIRGWWDEGTAAGNLTDQYDNRDGFHSRLKLEEFPQLRLLKYTDEEKQGRADWGACTVVRPQVTLGNSSTASMPEAGGCIPRSLYTRRDGLALLHRQYRANNLYVYPEHLDHDPGRIGPAGWGDLFPANTPYLIASQGSSSSDQPFLRAVAWTLASFRPETKAALAEHGLLMPTIQMLLRLTARHVGTTNLYLSGVAHPSVLDGAEVQPQRMIELAHRITPDCLPPFAQIGVVSEDQPRPGLDDFPVVGPERLADTPAALARIWRGIRRTRRMVLNAESSFDVHQRPLTYHWAVLRGSPAEVTIRPLNDRASVVEATFSWPGRRPIAPGHPLESSRLDLALFVNNGTWWSPPAFVTWYASPRECRTYRPDGQPATLQYAAPAPSVELPKLSPLLDWLDRPPFPAQADLFRRLAGPELLDRLTAQAEAIRRLEGEAARKGEALAEARASVQARKRSPRPAGEDQPGAEDDGRTATRQLDAATRAASAANRAASSLTDPLRKELLQALLNRIYDPAQFEALGDVLRPALDSLPAEPRQRLRGARSIPLAAGLLPGPETWTFRSRFEPGPSPAELQLIAEFQATTLSLVLPEAVVVGMPVYYADPILFPHFRWRDVYDYDAAGRMLGWRRYQTGPARRFTREGFLVQEEDSLGRPRQVVDVVYRAGNFSPGTRTFTYQYQGPDDLRGRPVPAEAVPPAP